MPWLFVAALSPALHGLSNVVDTHLSNNVIRSSRSLVFYTSVMGLVPVPFLLLVETPKLPPSDLYLPLLLIALIELLYLVPYYRALQEDEPSVVTSLFSLGKIFVPVMAYLVVGEKIGMGQYLGFVLIVLASSAMTYDQSKPFEFSKSFYYMLVVALLLSLEAGIYKYLFERTSWSAGFVIPVFLTAALSSTLLLSARTRRAIVSDWPLFRRNIGLFLATVTLTFCGSAAAAFALSTNSVTLERGVASLQPIFVLVYAIAIQKIAPGTTRERITPKAITTKVALFCIMLLGVAVMLR